MATKFDEVFKKTHPLFIDEKKELEIRRESGGYPLSEIRNRVS